MALKHPFPATVFKSRFPRVFSGISSLLLTAAALNAPAHAQTTSGSVSLTFSGKKVTYNTSSDWVAFQVKPSASVSTTIKGLSTLTALDAKTPAMQISTDMVALKLSSSASAYSKTELTSRLNKATSIQRKLRVFGSGSYPIVESTDALVSFASNLTDAQKKNLLSKQGATLVGPLGAWAPNAYRVRVSSANTYSTTVANNLLSSGAAKWAHPDLAMRQKSFATTNDPIFPQQWHLLNTGSNGGIGGTKDADVKATQAWDVTRGSGIKIAIHDDGVDVDHEDLKARFVTGKAFGDESEDPRPRLADNNHGTSVAGLALASGNNGIGVSGVAPEASLIAVRTPYDRDVLFSMVAESLVWPVDQGADIISCSWGFPSLDGVAIPDALGAALDYAKTKGRGGKGTIVLYAAANDNIDAKNGLNYDERVITVAATTRRDKKSEYSNFGAAVDVAAPGGYLNGDMVTTDRTGTAGYANGNYNTGFNGTSAATPVASGVTALILAANPGLTSTQVYSILTSTADKIDPGFGAYDSAGRSKYYGYGRLNAFKAVTAAKALLGANVTITTPEANAEYSRDDLTEANGTGDERTATVNVGLVKTDSSGKRLAYLNFTTAKWVTLATTTTSVGMYAADFDDEADTWKKAIPSGVLGGGYYQFLAQGYTADAIAGVLATASFKIDLIGVSVSSPTINTQYSSGTASSSYPLISEASGTADDDASNVGVALIKKNAAGQSVYHWDFSAADQTVSNWIPLNRDTMMAPATLGASAGGQVNWNLSMPTLAAGKYEVRVQGTDVAGVDGDITSVPFTVAATDGTLINVSLTPANVKVAAGKAVAFKATYDHSISVSKLKFLFFQAKQGEGDSAITIQVRYDIANNIVSIYDTASARWLNGYKPGTKVTVTSTTANLNVRQCKFTQPKPKKAVAQPISFTFSIIPRISGTYTTSIRCGTESVFTDYENKGTMTVTAGKSVKGNSLEPSDPNS